jgi:hypothetical protein
MEAPLSKFSMSPGPEKPIAALLDLPVDDVYDVRATREAVDQIGEHLTDGNRGDWQSVGAHGRILLDRSRQGVARKLNDHLLLAGKRVFRHSMLLASCVYDAIKYLRIWLTEVRKPK